MNKVSMRLDYVTENFPLEEQFRIASEVGVDGVETGQMLGYDCRKARELADKYGIPFVGIGFYDIMNCRIGAPWKEIESSFMKTVECAGVLGANYLLTLGPDVAERGEAAAAAFAENIKPAVEVCAKHDLTLLLEPHSTKYPNPFGDFSHYFINTSEIALDLIHRIDSPYVKMLFDCYHIQTMEGDLLKKIEKNLSEICHFHIAGTPDRDEPWKGEINYPNLVAQVKKMGYDGYFGLEYYPENLSDIDTLGRAVKYIKES